MLSKSLKILIVGLALVISNSSFAQSQGSQVKKQNPDRTEFLKKELNLNTNQIQSLDIFFAEYTKALKDIRLNRNLDKTSRSDQMVTVKEDYYKSIKSVLTEEQFSKYLEAYDGSSKSTDRNRKVE
jgi:hypothetical protein